MKKEFSILILALAIFSGLVAACIVAVDRQEYQRFQALEYRFEPAMCVMSETTCEILVRVSNPTNEKLSPQYMDTGGGPGAKVTYNLTLYDAQNRQCHANLDPVAFDDIAAHATLHARMRCSGDRPKDMGRAVRALIYGKEYRL